MKKLALLLCITCVACELFAHDINYVLEDEKSDFVLWNFIWIGFKHILPLGVDHILFILCLFFPSQNLRSILVQASMFTLAHSITLGLTAAGIIRPPQVLVEVVIAGSIAFLAIENIFRKNITKTRLAAIFIFGLVHGMGFAGAMAETDIPQNALLPAIIGFNIGVEIGQLVILFLAYILLSYHFANKYWYRERIIVPGSLLVLFVSLWWVVERTFNF
ncbi:MAG: HupE/UreJ family protein [Chitinophagales bacterium]